MRQWKMTRTPGADTMHLLHGLLPACLLLACSLPATAHEAVPASGDASVAAKLDARGISHEVDADGDYKVVYSWQKENRTQLVFIGGRAEQAGALRIREVFAPVARLGAQGMDAEVAATLLRDNRRKILGHWAADDAHLYYVIQVPDGIDAVGLETAIEFAAEIADDKEIELTGSKDEF
jgi:hypothetical protein